MTGSSHHNQSDFMSMAPTASLPGLVIGAPRSGGGKTTLTLGLLRALTKRGHKVQPFKCGPDYIDPAFHTHAAKRASINLDSWAMQAETVSAMIAQNATGADFAIAEGLMGVFDGVATPGTWGTGASADTAAANGWPILLVLDVSGQSQTAAAVAHGFANYRSDVTVGGVILNRVGSERHMRLVGGAIEAAGLKLLGGLPRRDDITLPERHLGLVVAEETTDLEARLEALAGFVSEHIDLDAIPHIAKANTEGFSANTQKDHQRIVPPGQRIALARDAAFSFIYPHLLTSWRAAGAEITTFSPLANEAPDPSADVVWLPGGYPELHAEKLANAENFLQGVRKAAEAKPVHGECGGFMVLGKRLEDKAGNSYAMAGLLDLETSFHKRRMHLGYRRAVLKTDCPIGTAGTTIRGHEFHYASILKCEEQPLADLYDAQDKAVAEQGARRSNVSGSFFHMIDVSN